MFLIKSFMSCLVLLHLAKCVSAADGPADCPGVVALLICRFLAATDGKQFVVNLF